MRNNDLIIKEKNEDKKKRKKATPKKTFTLSDEQKLFIAKALLGFCILVNACIGSGKTTAIQRLCDAFDEGVKILYLTYNKLLKVDARSKIKRKGVTVTNYHGFASYILCRNGIYSSMSDLIQTFINSKPGIPHYDVLIIDEYQDIELEHAKMLMMIKEANPNIQIIAVGDMAQKIYDKTTLDVEDFIKDYLGDHIELEFTNCFRLSPGLASKLGRIWNKDIAGVNPDCKVNYMSKKDVVDFLAEQKPGDILCIGASTGTMAETLNVLEQKYPEKYNKKSVYAKIQDSDSLGATKPSKRTAIFTTYDGCKGLERKIVIVFDFTESYWSIRLGKPMQSYEILRNIFCVAASRGKELVIFVKTEDAMLSERTLSTPRGRNMHFDDMNISGMFSFKYKEDIERCFKLIGTNKIVRDDMSPIDIENKDGLIDLSPCIAIYQNASFFHNYVIDKTIEFHMNIDRDKSFLYTDDVKNSDLEKKILFMTSLQTGQNRYRNQVEVPFVSTPERKALHDRLLTVFDGTEDVQVPCIIDFAGKESGDRLFSAVGMVDVIKDNTVFVPRFVADLSHEHFLQCATYVVATGFEKGILWNVRDNSMYEVTVPDKKGFLDMVVCTITKNAINTYYSPEESYVEPEL